MNFDEIELPSNKKFGYTFSIIFVLFSTYFILNGGTYLSLFCIILSIIIFIITINYPEKLFIFNMLWMKLGFLLGKIISPIVMSILFFLLITPVALITKIFGRDELLLKKKNDLSYWKKRDKKTLSTNNFEKQF